ncbi:MAG: tetratricopeptide repeat protein, partial [Deltaproteobacteria bacterium]|nr:tetratricopeptide repeat protein [Deltaproteobacteria bacterium]
MKRHMEKDLPKGIFHSLILDKILVDVFKPKFGGDKDLAVFSFFVKQRDAANKLMSYIVQKNFDILDIEVSPDPKENGQYILFIEMDRNKNMYTTMDKLLEHIDHLVSIKQWHFRTSAYKEYMDWDRDNFVKAVPQTPDECSNKEPLPGEQDETGQASQNSTGADVNHLLLEELIDKQVVKFNQSYIQSLKEQIKAINEDKSQMFRHIDDLKLDREHLHKQLELYHDREKLALIREQQDFKRIKSLENQLALLAAPVSGEMKIVTPNKSAYKADVKSAIGVVSTEKKVKDGKEISSPQNKYSDTSKGKQHPDKTPNFNKSSGLDANIEIPVKRTDRKVFRHNEKEAIEELDIEKTNWPRDPLVSEEDEEAPVSNTPLKIQNRKHIESEDSAAASNLDDIVAQSEIEESTVKVDDEPYLADDPVPKYMLLGREALKKEDYDNAIKYFLKVVEILPTSGAVVLNLADLYFLKKDYKTARKYAALALELGEESATSVLEEINTALVSDKGLPSNEKSEKPAAPAKDDTEEPKTKVTKKNPEEEDDLENTVFIELDALNEALDSAENIAPGSVEVDVSKDDGGKPDQTPDQSKEDARRFMAFGVEAATHKHYREAIEHFNKSVEIFPENAAGFCNLAVLNYRLKEYESAHRYAKRAIELGSPSAIQILEKIKAVMAVGKKSPAKFQPDAEIEKLKSSHIGNKYKRDAFFIESDDDTLAEFIKVEKENQADLAVDVSLREKDAVVNDHFKRGLVAFEEKKFRKAIGYFNKVVKLLPNGVPSYIHLTKIHYYLGEYEQARQHAKKAFDLGDHTLKPILNKIDSKLAKKSGPIPSKELAEPKEQQRPAKTVEDAKGEPEKTKSLTDQKPDKKEESDPEDRVKVPKVKLTESAALVEPTGHKEVTAPGPMEKAVSRDNNKKMSQKNDAKKYMALGVEAAGQRDHRKAVEHFSRVIEILPDSAVGFFNLAILYFHLEKYDMAYKHA